MLLLNADDTTHLLDALDKLSWDFADKPMAPERKASYLESLLRDPDVEAAAQLLVAIARTRTHWAGTHFPWPGDILGHLPRPHRLQL